MKGNRTPTLPPRPGAPGLVFGSRVSFHPHHPPPPAGGVFLSRCVTSGAVSLSHPGQDFPLSHVFGYPVPGVPPPAPGVSGAGAIRYSPAPRQAVPPPSGGIPCAGVLAIAPPRTGSHPAGAMSMSVSGWATGYVPHPVFVPLSLPGFRGCSPAPAPPGAPTPGTGGQPRPARVEYHRGRPLCTPGKSGIYREKPGKPG